MDDMASNDRARLRLAMAARGTCGMVMKSERGSGCKVQTEENRVQYKQEA